MIGIVGGVGPLAGLDVFKKIIEETDVQKDQDHLPVLLMSYPHLIVDRTEYLLNKIDVNPAYALADIIKKLADNGVTAAAIPCNTAHAQAIFSVVEQELAKNKVNIKLLHLVKETVNQIKLNAPNAKVAVLSTTGTRNTGLYKNILVDAGLTVVEPSIDWQNRVHDAIYDPTYGIKAFSSPVKEKAVQELQQCIDVLIQENATHFILGCTELPLAFPETSYKGIPLIDPNRIIARALIREVAAEKLKKQDA
ncbi:amino acid racemase [Pedobacter sp. UBA4863]|uniref:aspartate/glutamate racemase family protein n=1 Tax=Pedobacter sp. UBA4863 TaxID=1947060 RepID=UPI0025FE5581|nr:amino acid racemase [Pedobacter sp. UBA4863]